MQSVGTVNFVSGTATSTGGGTSSKARKRNVSGWSINYAVFVGIGCLLDMNSA
jgi:hypothetical protein